MAPSPNMGFTEPTDHGDDDLWGSILNDVLDIIDAHDHTAGKGALVPSAGLKINADVSWSFGGTNYAITAAKALDFTPVAATSVSSYSSALFANSSDSNNLYYRNSAGTNVKITDGSTLNVSIVGGIGGDYTSIGALLDYDDASDTYRFRQESSASVRQFARAAIANLDLYEYKAAGSTPVPSNRVRISSPAALAASYELTLPGAVPAAPAIVQVSAAGVVSFSNTTTQVIRAQDFEFTTEQYLFVPASAATPQTTGGTGPSWNGTSWTVGTTTGTLTYPFGITAGTGSTSAVITGYTFYFRKTSATGTIAGQAYDINDADGTIVTTGMGGALSNSANNPGYVSYTVSGLTKTVSLGHTYYFSVVGGGTTGDLFLGLGVLYKRV